MSFNIEITALGVVEYMLFNKCVTSLHCFLKQVIVVLPTDRKDRYDAIKKFCCVDHPGTVCVCLSVY